MRGLYPSLLLFSLSLFVNLTVAQSSQTFCNRLYHSSIVVNNQLYVDGGELRQHNATGFVNVSLPNALDTVDLSKSWGNEDDSLWSHISKEGVNINSSPPILNDGSIFSDSSSLYFFGGALSLAPGAPSTPPPNALWQYDIQKRKWNKAALGGEPVERIHIGSNVQSSKLQGYYLGGAITPRSDAAFLALDRATPYMVEGLLEFNESSIAFSNVSTNGLNDQGTVAAGFLSLIESLGDEGVLVAFGGFFNAPGQPMDLGSGNLQNPIFHRQLGNVSVFDISKQKWYQQTATGSVPPWRYFGCSVAVSAPDKSSHSIYVFGGWGGNSRNSDGHVYVLSIPSFRWIQVTDDNNQRQRHQCHLLGEHTMLVVGGIQPGKDNMQPEDVSGCDSSSKFSQGLGIFSLNDHLWKSDYDPTDGVAAYRMHPSISKVIGGDENGAATLTTPDGGFSEQALGSLVGARERSNTTPNVNSSSTPSPSPSGTPSARKKLSGGAIAGIVIGAIVLVVLAAGVLVFVMLQRRRQRQTSNTVSSNAQPMKRFGELDGTPPPLEISGRPKESTDEKKPFPLELMAQDKPLPEAPGHDRHVEPQEMDAAEATGWKGTGKYLSQD